MMHGSNNLGITPTSATADDAAELALSELAPTDFREAHPDLNTGRSALIAVVKIPADTMHGADVLNIFARGYNWTISERHALMSIDHLLFALAERQLGANALLAHGVISVAELEIELLNLVHKSPAEALSDGEHPKVDDAVLAVLNHALGYARHNGRDHTNLSDLIDALCDALRSGKTATPGLTALRRRWPRSSEDDYIRQALTNILEVQTNQPTILAKAMTAELTALRDRIGLLEQTAVDAISSPSLPWYRRLNVLLLAFGLICVVPITIGL